MIGNNLKSVYWDYKEKNRTGHLKNLNSNNSSPRIIEISPFSNKSQMGSDLHREIYRK
jgi:hypothetical protein